MSTFTINFREEVNRLARKEIKKQLEPVKQSNTKLKKELSALKKQLKDLERQLARAQRLGPQKAKATKPAQKLRYSAKGLISLRKRLGITQTEFGNLIGVTQNSVHNWESLKSQPRKAQLEHIAELRTKGKKEVRKALQAMSKTAASGD